MENYIKDKQLELDFGETKTPFLSIGEFYQFCTDYSIYYKVFGDGRKSNFDKNRKVLEINPTYENEAFSVVYEFIGHYANTNRDYSLSPHQQLVVTDYFYDENKESIDKVVDNILNKRFTDVERILEDIGD